jgi:hypothetical protein
MPLGKSGQKKERKMDDMIKKFSELAEALKQLDTQLGSDDRIKQMVEAYSDPDRKKGQKVARVAEKDQSDAEIREEISMDKLSLEDKVKAVANQKLHKLSVKDAKSIREQLLQIAEEVSDLRTMHEFTKVSVNNLQRFIGKPAYMEEGYLKE